MVRLQYDVRLECNSVVGSCLPYVNHLPGYVCRSLLYLSLLVLPLKSHPGRPAAPMRSSLLYLSLLVSPLIKSCECVVAYLYKKL